jgi:hypothetical protein
VEGDFVTVEVGEDFGRIWKIAFKTIAYGKVGIQLPCGLKEFHMVNLAHGLRAHEFFCRIGLQREAICTS